MMPDEIWFRKWLWSYVPVHWKGLVLIFATVVAVLTSFAGLVILADVFNWPALAFTIPVPFAFIVLRALAIARRHSC